MADDNSNNDAGAASSASSTFSSTPQANDRSQILAQATRFLTSANISESASDDDKRDFLRSKGLSEDEITRVFQDSKSPAASARSNAAHQSTAGDMDAFELAARQFDDPVNADALVPPPKSYPNSPLALYYDPPAPSAQTTAQPAHNASPLTRYQVLLQFFRTLSFMMMLGGGLTAILVSAYRSYILPKITAMFDARSIVLKHHIVLFDKLRSNVASLATYVPIPHGRLNNTDETAVTSPLKGVLKKVHFHDEVEASVNKDGEKEGVKSTQHGGDAKPEKVVTAGTDVVVTAKTPLLSDREGSETDASTVDGEESEPAAAKLEPIDLMSPLRESMAKLAEALKGELSGRPAPPATNATTSPRRTARVASVTDADSDEWEDDSSSDANASDPDDDGLEFDPYGAYQKKHKHTQTSSTSTTSPATSGSVSLANLKSTLVSLNADISTHAFTATSASNAGGGGAFRFGPAPNSGAESPKSGDLGQVKAEIRSLKGLLLSRRNFPSYAARPPPLPNAAEARSTSAVV